MKRLKWLSLKHQVWWSLYLKERKNLSIELFPVSLWASSSPPLVCSVHLHYTLTRPPQKWECLLALIIMPIYIMANNIIIMPIIFPPSSNGMEKEMATHSSTLAWKIPWTEEPGGLQSMGSWRVGHDWATSLSCMEKEMATHSSVLAWRIPGMAEPGGLLSMGSHTRTWLKWLSSSSSSNGLS